MDKDITLEDIDEIIKDLKSDKSPGVTGFTNEFYREFNKDLNIWILNYIRYTYQEGTLLYMQRRGAITLIPKGEKDKRDLGNWRPITLLNTLYKLISAILAKKIKKGTPENNRPRTKRLRRWAKYCRCYKRCIRHHRLRKQQQTKRSHAGHRFQKSL